MFLALWALLHSKHCYTRTCVCIEVNYFLKYNIVTRPVKLKSHVQFCGEGIFCYMSFAKVEKNSESLLKAVDITTMMIH